MAEPTVFWIEMTGSQFDGKAVMVPRDAGLCVVEDDEGLHSAVLVPTGSVRWVGDTPIEVFVPEDKLHAWQAEHQP